MELDLTNIQGNIVPGFNKDNQAFVLLRFSSAEAGRKWLARLQPDIASAREVDGFRTAFKSMTARRPEDGMYRGLSATWINVALSYAGLALLTHARTGFSQQFRLSRVPLVGASSIRGEVHGMLIIAADRPDDAASELECQRQRLAAHGLEEVTTFHGVTLPGAQRGREHFGFKDGMSQPKIAGTPWGDGPDVAPGEFILGLPDQTGQSSGKGLPAWTRNGSFLAFVQLQQDVGSFWNAMRDQSAQLYPAAQPCQLAAWIVGRKPDGALLPDPPSRFSHIGRAYSRWQPLGEALRHRIIRRGIPYGPPWAEGSDDTDRGLLFVAYQADIERQFEHVWTRWLNMPGFPMPGSGRDALVGQMNGQGQSQPNRLRPAAAARPDQGGGTVSLRLPSFVTPGFGAYFFAPAIDKLSLLADANTQ